MKLLGKTEAELLSLRRQLYDNIQEIDQRLSDLHMECLRKKAEERAAQQDRINRGVM